MAKEKKAKADKPKVKSKWVVFRVTEEEYNKLQGEAGDISVHKYVKKQVLD